MDFRKKQVCCSVGTSFRTGVPQDTKGFLQNDRDTLNNGNYRNEKTK